MNRSLVLGIVLGTAIGAVVGIFLAPGTGAQTPVQLAAKSKNVGERISKAGSSIARKPAEVEETIKQAI